MSRKTKSWQLKLDDEPYEKLREILEKWGFDQMSDPLEELRKNILEMDARGEQPHRTLTLRLKRRS